MIREAMPRGRGERRIHLRLMPRQSRSEGGILSSLQLPPAEGNGIAHGPEEHQPKLLDHVRQAIRVRHYSLRTEESYVHWINRFILFHGKRSPQELVVRHRNFDR